MAGSIYKIQVVFVPFKKIFHLYGMTFYCYASLPFKVHIIKNLVLEFSFRNCIRFFKKPVSQGAFAVVYMSNNTEITDIVHQGCKFKIRCKYIKIKNAPQPP